jgi:hypothetical protein
MSTASILGFFGDFLSFLGGLVLAADAILEEHKLKQRHAREDAWKAAITDPVVAHITLTREGIKLKNEKDIAASLEISMSRRTRQWAIIGALILSTGFACLFCSRWIEIQDRRPIPLDIHPDFR